MQPYERMPREPAKAWAAFRVYRDLGPGRSLTKVAQQLGKSIRTIEKWSSRWRWVERVTAWDDEQDRQARAAQLEAIKEMCERHAREAMWLQQKAIERLRNMDPRELSPADVMRYLIEAAKLERLSRGEPDVIQEHKGTVTVRGEQNVNLVQRIVADPEARELARRLYDRVASGRENAGQGRSGELLPEGNS